jgi:hypothetical protein
MIRPHPAVVDPPPPRGPDHAIRRLLLALAIIWPVGTIALYCIGWWPVYNGLLDARAPATPFTTAVNTAGVVWAFTVPAIGLVVSLRRYRNAIFVSTFAIELTLSTSCCAVATLPLLMV